MWLENTGGPCVENLGNVLENRTQAWSLHLKKVNHQTSSVVQGKGKRGVGYSKVGEAGGGRGGAQEKEQEKEQEQEQKQEQEQEQVPT